MTTLHKTPTPKEESEQSVASPNTQGAAPSPPSPLWGGIKGGGLGSHKTSPLP